MTEHILNTGTKMVILPGQAITEVHHFRVTCNGPGHEWKEIPAGSLREAFERLESHNDIYHHC